MNYKGAKSFGGTYVQYPPFTAVHIDNVADSAAQSGSIEVTLEQLGEWNPDYMFLNAGNMGVDAEGLRFQPGVLRQSQAFQAGNLYTSLRTT